MPKQPEQRRVMTWGCALLCVGMLCGCSVDPYNALLWNRDHALSNSGYTDTQPWFEWWFYKVVLPETGDAFYFIYGVVNPWDTAMEHPASRAYVGMGHSALNVSVESVYPVSDFNARYWVTDVRIQDQHATDSEITGTLVDHDGGQVTWDIQINRQWSFNAMGWAMFVPDITNIAWYPAQADALFSGQINYKGEVYTFENAPGYQDRNWGRTFPEWWVWIVSNHFEDHPETTLAVGGGKPIILDTVDIIEGVSIGLLHEGNKYVFRPMDLDRVRVDIRFGTWIVEAINAEGYRIEIEAYAPCEAFTDILFVTPQGEEFHDYEALTGDVTVRLYERSDGGYGGWELIETLESAFAGIEYGHRDLARFDCFEKESKTLYSNF